VLIGEDDVEALWQAVEAAPTLAVTVDLVAREVRYADVVLPFEIDDYTRWRLIEGLDDIGLTLRHADDVDTFETQRPAWKPRTIPAAV
jgi:3-isopropylmalate/(R)-2-methylmalate dehydratase small subunit